MVPIDSRVKEKLLEAGLGESKICITNVDDCTAAEFKAIVIKQYPKLSNCGGFELLRCVTNSKSLEVVSPRLARVPRMLKSVIGTGKVFIRPIQKDLDLDATLDLKEVEVSYDLLRYKI